MIIYPSLPSGHTVFCDDVRQEASGKQTYVGTYNSIMFVAGFPATLPQIHCVITYREEVDALGDVAIRVIHEVNDEDTVIAEINISFSDSPPPPTDMTEPFLMKEAKLIVPLSPFNIEAAGCLKVRAFRGEDEIRLGSLKIKEAPPALIDGEPS